ncbi:hypothetical protein COS83_05105 [archaeon CG07_land_8_20_14_0_80_38_8]|nr:MAG: hypothetical protein COS83_05105 [archaeon CG07_land_8_20_14_0_80_38_8]
MNDLLLVLLLFAYVAVVLLISLTLHYKKIIRGRTARNLVHFFSGFSILFLFIAENKYYLLIASAVITLMLFLARKKTPLLKYVYKAIKKKEEKNFLEGPVLYGVSITLMVYYSIIADNNIIPLISILVLTISDPLASIIGRKFGKNKLINNRTLEGSTAMAVSSLAIISLFQGFSITAIIQAVLIAFAELLSPSKWDDLTVPLFTAALLTLAGP